MAVVKQEEDEGSQLASIADPLANAPRGPREKRNGSHAGQRGQARSGSGFTDTTSYREPNRGTFGCAGVGKKKKARAGGGPGPMSMYNHGPSTEPAYGAVNWIEVVRKEEDAGESMPASKCAPQSVTVNRIEVVKKEEDAGENALVSKYVPQSATVGAGSPGIKVKVEANAGENTLLSKYENMLKAKHAPQSATIAACSPGTMVKVEADRPASGLTFFAGGSPQVYTTDISSRFTQDFGVDESRLDIVDPSSKLTHLRCPYQDNAAYGDSLVVAVKGAHPGYGSGARGRNAAAYGVFFGPNNDMNKSGPIEDGTNTFRRAELYAAAAGVRAVREFCERVLASAPPGVSHGIKRLVVKSSEEYVVSGIAGGDRGQRPWIMNWEENGFLTQEGTGVQSRDLWVKLAEEVRKLGRLGVTVQFWEVSEGRNREASGLAEMHTGCVRGLVAPDERSIYGASQPSMSPSDRSLWERQSLVDMFLSISKPYRNARRRR